MPQSKAQVERSYTEQKKPRLFRLDSEGARNLLRVRAAKQAQQLASQKALALQGSSQMPCRSGTVVTSSGHIMINAADRRPASQMSYAHVAVKKLNTP